MPILIKQSGSQGPKGSTGWTPVISNVADGTRIVQKVTDWFGGQGVKPAINQYLTSTGFSNNIALAVDIRGYGDAGDCVMLISQTIVAKNHTSYLIPNTLSGMATNISFPEISSTQGFEIEVISMFDNICIINFPVDYIAYKPSSRSIGATFENINFIEIGASSFTLPKGKFTIRAYYRSASNTRVVYIY